MAIGMHMAADMSCRLGWIDQKLVDRSVELMKKAGLPVELPKGGGMDMDKFLNVSNLAFQGAGFNIETSFVKRFDGVWEGWVWNEVLNKSNLVFQFLV